MILGRGAGQGIGAAATGMGNAAFHTAAAGVRTINAAPEAMAAGARAAGRLAAPLGTGLRAMARLAMGLGSWVMQTSDGDRPDDPQADEEVLGEIILEEATAGKSKPIPDLPESPPPTTTRPVPDVPQTLSIHYCDKEPFDVLYDPDMCGLECKSLIDDTEVPEHLKVGVAITTDRGKIIRSALDIRELVMSFATGNYKHPYYGLAFTAQQVQAIRHIFMYATRPKCQWATPRNDPTKCMFYHTVDSRKKQCIHMQCELPRSIQVDFNDIMLMVCPIHKHLLDITPERMWERLTFRTDDQTHATTTDKPDLRLKTLKKRHNDIINMSKSDVFRFITTEDL